ncbi:MAG: restriction endonuclease subunit R [Bacteroidota bacterium]
MFKIPKRVLDRFRTELKRYGKVTASIRSRDVSEADTVTVVKDMLADVFGFDKYLELTSEQQIRGTYCDLAVKIDGKIKYLIEVKSAGTDLNESHIRQAINYGAKEGIEWIVLTNGISWHLYRLKFAQPIEHEEVSFFDATQIDLKKEDDQKKLFLLSREAISGNAMDEYHKHSQLLNMYTIAQVLMTEPVVNATRREFRKLFPDFKVDKEEIAQIISEEILKREVAESDKAQDAAKNVKKAAKSLARRQAKAAAAKGSAG